MKITTFIFILTIGFLFSCNQPLQENATISLMLVDAPAVYDEVWIDVVAVRIKYENADEDMGWLEIKDFVPAKYNLLEYCNGKDTLLVSSLIAAGTISQIRLILGDGNYVVADGKAYTLETPSASTSGLKINVHEEFESGVEKLVWLDFNAAKSIVTTGNGKYKLNPVIRTYTTSTSGAIKGSVYPKESFPYVYVILEKDTLGTFADENGLFLIPGIPGGTYTVQFDVLEPYIDKSIGNVTVSNGQSTDLGEVIISQ